MGVESFSELGVGLKHIPLKFQFRHTSRARGRITISEETRKQWSEVTELVAIWCTLLVDFVKNFSKKCRFLNFRGGGSAVGLPPPHAYGHGFACQVRNENGKIPKQYRSKIRNVKEGKRSYLFVKI